MQRKNMPLPLAQNEPGPPTNFNVQIIFGVTGQRYQAPGFIVPPGCTVTVEPVNGTDLNVNPCYVAQDSAAIGTNRARVIVAGTGDVVVPWPVANLAEIYCSGTDGDGLLIKVQGGGIQ
jgi:hypothetical protein